MKNQQIIVDNTCIQQIFRPQKLACFYPSRPFCLDPSQTVHSMYLLPVKISIPCLCDREIASAPLAGSGIVDTMSLETAVCECPSIHFSFVSWLTRSTGKHDAMEDKGSPGVSLSNSLQFVVAHQHNFSRAKLPKIPSTCYLRW